MNYRLLISGAVLALALATAGAPEVRAEKKHDHAGHDHDSHGHGTAQDLGTTTVAGVKLTVVQEGEVKPGGEAAFEIELNEGQKKPRAVRVWVGIESARGSVKAKAEAKDQGFHAHVEVPKKLPEGSRLWIEVDPGEGKREKASFELKL